MADDGPEEDYVGPPIAPGLEPPVHPRARLPSDPKTVVPKNIGPIYPADGPQKGEKK